MIHFPSVDQFRQTVREVKANHDYQDKDENGDAKYLHISPYPTIEFTGTVKLHGANAAVVLYKDGHIEYQSRERVLELQRDNLNFMLNMMGKDFSALFNQYYFAEHIAIFGEWCGQGIQKGVAISGLPKMFVIFGVNVDGQWVDIVKSDLPESVYLISDFPYYKIVIDFNSPELVQNELIKFTEEVEKQCPVGLHFGAIGIGEGIVWEGEYNDRSYWFKVKGEKHSISKAKTLASVDVEMVENINEFVDNVLTEQRLEQGINW